MNASILNKIFILKVRVKSYTIKLCLDTNKWLTLLAYDN